MTLDWGNIIGSLIQTAVVVAGGGYSYWRFRQDKRARLGDFHVILRKIDAVTASDHPIDSPGFWVVFSNGTGLPVSWWTITVYSDSDSQREYELKSSRFGPILPTSAGPMARKVPVEGLGEGVELLVKEWRFRSGGRYWRADERGFTEFAPSSAEGEP